MLSHFTSIIYAKSNYYQYNMCPVSLPSQYMLILITSIIHALFHCQYNICSVSYIRNIITSTTYGQSHYQYNINTLPVQYILSLKTSIIYTQSHFQCNICSVSFTAAQYMSHYLAMHMTRDNGTKSCIFGVRLLTEYVFLYRRLY